MAATFFAVPRASPARSAADEATLWADATALGFEAVALRELAERLDFADEPERPDLLRFALAPPLALLERALLVRAVAAFEREEPFV